MTASMFLVLILALKDTTDFKETRLICKEVEYTYKVKDRPETFIRANGKDYLTKFNDIEDLASEVDKQCSPRKKKK